MELPTSKKEMERLGWDYVDVILISGDAYIDHPSFGTAIIARVLENAGYRVAVVPQPNWRDDLRDFKKLGTPRLFFGVNSGSMDSMVNHYTSTKRLRSNDAYTPGGLAGQRPDYAVTVYSNILKKLFPDVPVVIGGIEASLRRFSHYDYWSDSYKKSVLIDSNADILIYGMGERPILSVAKAIAEGKSLLEMSELPQIAYVTETLEHCKKKPVELFSYEDCLRDKILDAKNFRIIEEQSNLCNAERIAQKYGDKYVVVNEPYPTIPSEELDAIYALPYSRMPHSRYAKKPSIPAFDMIKDSVTIHRGCFGACSFCTISAHQGKFISSRSEESVLKELKKIAENPNFKGHITDLGAPSANMYGMHGKDTTLCQKCRRASCLVPQKCKNLNDSHVRLTKLYEKAEQIKGIKHLTIGSGIRYDLLQGAEGEKEYMSQLIRKHVSGRLKVAPEHTEDSVLKLMRKPSFSLFEKFKKTFDELNQKYGMREQIIPYFISSHPGCKAQDMKCLEQKLRMLRVMPEQVQDFTPTPMTLSTTMYYTGVNPYTLEPIFSAKTKEDKDKQKSFFFWYKGNRSSKNEKPDSKSALQKKGTFQRTDKDKRNKSRYRK
ncbi:MAG: YgiQ family radical SAM protein [Bacteroidales bacterium]|nr:YgiQ family radical SAM protein [Bacteroidales bacterium]